MSVQSDLTACGISYIDFPRVYQGVFKGENVSKSFGAMTLIVLGVPVLAGKRRAECAEISSSLIEIKNKGYLWFMIIW